MGIRRVKLSEGQVFAVPLVDGRSALGQIISIEPGALNSVGCVFFPSAYATTNAEIARAAVHDEPIAILLVTPDLLKRGAWPVVWSAPPATSSSAAPYERFREKGWIGARIRGSAIVQEFLSAYHGLVPWDDWADPQYLDSLLLSPDRKPPHLVYSKHAG